MPYVLLIEDDLVNRTGLSADLSAEGHTVRTAATVASGLCLAWEQRPDVVIVAVPMRHPNPESMVSGLVTALADVPVMAIAGHDDQVVALLNAGAIDCMIRPFSARLLLAKLRVVLREQPAERPGDREMVVGGLTINLTKRTAVLEGLPVPLSPLEFDLLTYLAQRAGRAVSKRELLAEVWHKPRGRTHATSRTVDVHISWLRSKLRETARAPRYVHTIRGFGFRLADPNRMSQQRQG